MPSFLFLHVLLLFTTKLIVPALGAPQKISVTTSNNYRTTFVHRPTTIPTLSNKYPGALLLQEYQQAHPQSHHRLSATNLKLHIQEGENCNKNNKRIVKTRRNILSSVSSLALTLAATTIIPQSSKAASSSSIRILQYPSLEYLEPIYELKLSIDALEKGLLLSSSNDDTSQRQRINIQKRLEKLFAGGIFSEKNFYLGLAVTYNNQIAYDTNRELSTYINLDKDERLNYIDSTLKSLESVKNTLKRVSTTAASVDEDILMNDIGSAQKSIKAWFAMVPTQDVDAVENLFRMTRGADANRDGKLDASELATLPEKEREIWIKRIALAGD